MKKEELERNLLDAYFDPGDICQEMLEILKSFAIQLIITTVRKIVDRDSLGCAYTLRVALFLNINMVV
jgi:hypothetical protein